MKGGHMALVCARPHVGNKAFDLGQELPESAGLMGIITLEDVLESLLQEQIYDEMDRPEREATRLANMVSRQWKRFVRLKKAGLISTAKPEFSHIVKQAVAASALDVEGGLASETTTLL